MTERRYSELRADGRRLSGVVVRYGDIANVGGVRERFMPGAFGPVEALDTILNVQHRRDRPIARTGGGGLDLMDGPDALRMAAELPTTREADDTLELVRTGVLRGLSVEFVSRSERVEGGVRVLARAGLAGLGVVDRPAYPSSTVASRYELRIDGAGLTGAFFYDADTVISDRNERALSVRKQRVAPGAFDFALADPSREVSLLLGRDYSRPLGSRLAGTLELEDTPEALRFNVERLPDTGYVRDFRAQQDAGSAAFGVARLFRMPPPDVVADAVEIVPENPADGPDGFGIEVIRSAVLIGLAILVRAPRGNPGELARRALWLSL